MFYGVNNMAHLTYQDRCEIEAGLNQNMSKKDIAIKLAKDPSTIGKEIKLHLFRSEPVSLSLVNGIEKCIHVRECYNCSNPKGCLRYEVRKCERRDLKPGYCNGCKSIRACRLHKIKYVAKQAQSAYETNLRISRQGHNNSHENVDYLKSEIAALIKQGQSPYVIVTNHPEFQLSERTIYHWIHEGKMRNYGITTIDLKESVKRKVKEIFYPKKPSNHYINHTFKDFIEKINNGEISTYLEMDTLYNNLFGPYLLTFIEPKTKFMFGKLIKSKTSLEVARQIRIYRDKLGKSFYNLFSTILTDRGTEFYNYDLLQADENGEIITYVYYCDAMQSCQKPHVENNHNFVRDVLENGRSFDDLNQDKINLMFSHINSYPRASLNNKTPYEMFTFMFGIEIATKLEIEFIKKDKVTLHKNLI